MKPHQLVFAIAISAICLGEESAPPVTDLEARRASVANLEAQIQQREERLAELGSEIVTLDGRIEKRVAELVSMLANMRDSKDSRFKVSQMKREAIDQLHGGIEMYARKRAQMAEKARKGDLSALGDLDKIDEHNLTRIEQIVELTKSFPTHRDVEKYESAGETYWNGYYHENTRVSDEWRQARRDRVQTDKQRKETAEDLRQGIDRIRTRRNSLVQRLEQPDLPEAERRVVIHDIGQADAILERLNRQLTAVVGNSGDGGERQPSLEEAVDVERLLDDARKDLREDVSRLFRLYDTFAEGRAKTAAMKENLQARKEWLKQHDSKEN